MTAGTSVLLCYSPTQRYTVFGAMSYTVFSAVGIILSLRSVARYTHFSEADVVDMLLGLYAFYSRMILFGFDGPYRAAPAYREWRYASMIKLHFWAAVYGIGLMTVMLIAGGIVQGSNMNDPSIAFSESTQSILPYLRGRSIAVVLMLAAHGVFAFHFVLMLLGLGRTASVPTFLNPVESEEGEPQL